MHLVVGMTIRVEHTMNVEGGSGDTNERGMGMQVTGCVLIFLKYKKNNIVLYRVNMIASCSRWYSGNGKKFTDRSFQLKYSLLIDLKWVLTYFS